MSVRDRRDFFKTVAGAAAGMYVMARGGSANAQAPAARRPVVIGGQRVRVVDVHAHCEMPLGDVVRGTPFENRAERATRLEGRVPLMYTTAPAVAAFARTNLLDTVSNTRYENGPTWFTNWDATGLLTFDDLNGDGIIQNTGPGSPIPNELTIDSDIMVLANPEIARLPNWVVGIVAAGGLAAAL